MAGESPPVAAKICGLTRPTDASLAVANGASRLGVIFAGGPRAITVGRAREIVAAAEGVPVLAVVRPGAAEALLRLADETGVRGVQLHGPATDDLAERLATAGLEVWRQVAIRDGDPVEALVHAAIPHADAVVIEPRDAGGRSGGRGLVLDGNSAVLARLALPATRMVLAGGLTAETVAAAIRRVRPDLVDVSSGVESEPGIKDPARLARFLEEVRHVRSPD